MHPPFASRRPLLPAGLAGTREGRDSELSRRMTALLLFPGDDALPGAWLMLLVAAWTYVAVRAMELASF